jgi:hypothetical protein
VVTIESTHQVKKSLFASVLIWLNFLPICTVFLFWISAI